ncbi:DUF1289 domain-containing protein [Burkholderia sp. Ac-20379]|uniref:DUF1289 domain-containing protein n=1 Tax=Burkholderia sp. Ac-20379 TaxID=2703900 RepID=UPI00403FBDD3
MNRDDAEVASPCVGVCRVDAQANWCTGCRRTLDEIAAWRDLDADGKRAVLARVEARWFEGR